MLHFSYMKYLKPLLGACLGFMMLFGGNILPAYANDLILGAQTHEYKVILRDDGRAIVIGKITAPNQTEENLSTITLNLGIDDAAQMSAYQLITEGLCTTYQSIGEIRTCITYRNPTSRDLNDATYEKISIVEENESSYSLNLPVPVEPGANALIIFAYSSKSYTSNFLGLYTYDFKTPTVDSSIQSMFVNVQTDSDLFLKGEGTTVQYSETDFAGGEFQNAMGPNANITLSALHTNQGNVVQESATSLFPGESYEVTGKYSEHWFRMHTIAIAIALALLVAIVGFIIWKQKHPRASTESSMTPKLSLHISLSENYLATGFISAALIAIWTLMTLSITESDFFNNLNGPMTSILVGLVIFMIYILVAFGPIIVLGLHKGWRSAIMAFVSTIVWLIIGITIFSTLHVEEIMHDVLNY